MEVFIRKAEEADVPAMLQLVKELAVFEKEPDAVTVTAEHMRETGFSQRPLWFGWVACRTSDEEIIGLAMCYLRYSTWKGTALYLEDIIVTDTMRGQGIGQRLFDICVQYAKDKAYPHMSWQVLDWNEGAIRFYKRNGAALDPEWLNGKLEFKVSEQ